MRPHQLPQFAGRPVAGAIGHNRGVVHRNYAFMPPEGVLVSRLPHVPKTIARILAAPVLGAGFAQYLLEIEPGGGMPVPFAEDGIQHFYYGLSGEATFAIDGSAASARAISQRRRSPPDSAMAGESRSAPMPNSSSRRA